MAAFIIYGLVAVLLGFIVYSCSPLSDKVAAKRAKEREAKDRVVNPDYWRAYDNMMTCCREQAQAYKKVTSLKEQIDKTIKELDYLPEDEAQRVRETKLYNLRKSYFYAKGKLSLANEKVENARKIHDEERAKRKRK